MTSETKPKAETKAKADKAPKSETTTSEKSAPTEGTKPASTEAAKPASTESGAAPANYSRGEGQKPVTAAYKENWNAIFGKKTAAKGSGAAKAKPKGTRTKKAVTKKR